MSQPDATMADLLTLDSESFTQTQLDTLFNAVEIDQTTCKVNDSEAFPDCGIDFQVNSYISPPASVFSSISSPSVTEDGFSELYIDYPSPGTNIPHPYPIEQQQYFNYNTRGSVPIDRRAQALLSLTNTSHLTPNDPPRGFIRRRSLSQGDVDHIAANYAQAPNPTFMRLMTPRPRSVTPDSVSRKQRGSRHSRSSSRIANGSYRELQSRPTSVPYYFDEKVPTPLGSSLSPESTFDHTAEQEQRLVQNGYNGGDTSDQVMLRHMVGLRQVERSRRIIEIGAMAVTEKIDPVLKDNGSGILKKLEQVERYVRMECGGCDEALKGCTSIREALKGKMRISYGDARHEYRSQFDAFEQSNDSTQPDEGAGDKDEIDRQMREATTPLCDNNF